MSWVIDVGIMVRGKGVTFWSVCVITVTPAQFFASFFIVTVSFGLAGCASGVAGNSVATGFLRPADLWVELSPKSQRVGHALRAVTARGRRWVATVAC